MKIECAICGKVRDGLQRSKQSHVRWCSEKDSDCRHVLAERLEAWERWISGLASKARASFCNMPEFNDPDGRVVVSETSQHVAVRISDSWRLAERGYIDEDGETLSDVVRLTDRRIAPPTVAPSATAIAIPVQ